MDPVVCRDRLDKLLAEESSAFEQLQTLLDREHELLVANDVKSLDRVAHARQSCIGTLMRIDDDRRSLCRTLNEPADMHGVDRILAWCDPSKRLRRRWNEVAERAERCRTATGRNGTLVATRLNCVQGVLDIVTGRADQPKIYGRQGAFQSQPRTGRVLVSV